MEVGVAVFFVTALPKGGVPGGVFADAAVSLSTVFDLAMAGFFGWGEKISAGELLSASSSFPLSRPVPESTDGRLVKPPLTAREPARDVRVLAVLVGPDAGGFAEAEETEGCRAVRDAGAAGGPIEVLAPTPPKDGRTLEPAEGARTIEGVPVRDVAVLEGPLMSCFVGDFVGDYYLYFGQKDS